MSLSEASAKDSIPKNSGTYILILHLFSCQSIQVGKLGKFDFPAGYYTYVGSAFGPGGLTGRLNRHVQLAYNEQGSKRLHWHIDYLRQFTRLIEIWYSSHDASQEHLWASLVGQLPGATVPVPHFGASDCRCQSHLFHFFDPQNSIDFQELLQATLPADALVVLDFVDKPN